MKATPSHPGTIHGSATTGGYYKWNLNLAYALGQERASTFMPIKKRFLLAQMYTRWAAQLLASADLMDRGQIGDGLLESGLRWQVKAECSADHRRNLAAICGVWAAAVIQDARYIQQQAGRTLVLLPLTTVKSGAPVSPIRPPGKRKRRAGQGRER